ncbi:MAG: ABC transporter permease subunit [Chloroflexota bacterium]|nr:MAG: ABC transporter permease subunit [Chloroflexota bacterium]
MGVAERSGAAVLGGAAIGLGPRLRARRSGLLTFLMLVPGIGAIIFLFLLPLWLVVELSFAPEGTDHGFTLANYATFLASDTLVGSFILSVILAVGATVFSIVLSVPLALVLRRPFHGNKLFRLLILLPLMVPALVSAVGLRIFWGDVGWANLTIQLLPFVNGPIRIVFTVPGLVLFYVWLFFPYTALLTLAALEGVDPAVEEAAEVAGASRWKVLRHILLPLAVPGILAGSVLTFIESFGAFSVPLITGGDYRPLSVQIYTVSAIFLHWNEGAAMSVIMGATQILFLVVYFRLLRRHQPA